MKHILLTLLSLFFIFLSSLAKDYTKEFTKLIQKHDVPALARWDTIPENFWNNVWKYNETFADYYEAAKKQKGAVKQAHRNLAEAALVAEPYYATLEFVSDEKTSELISSLENDLALLSLGAKIYVIYDDDLNAFSLPNGKIFLNSGLFSIPNIKYEHILGICAHEVTHYLLQHAAVSMYKLVKKEKKNTVIAGVAAAANIAANGYAAAQGVDVDWNNVNSKSYSLLNAAFKDTNKYYYKYSREQEIEADLTAFRFMECSGWGGKYYIEALQMIGENNFITGYDLTDDNDSQSDKYNYREALQVIRENDTLSESESIDDDHPSYKYRVSFLTFVSEHPEIYVNAPKKTIDMVR